MTLQKYNKFQMYDWCLKKNCGLQYSPWFQAILLIVTFVHSWLVENTSLDILQLPSHYTLIPVRWFLFAVEKLKSFVYPTLPVFWEGTSFRHVVKPEFKTTTRANNVRRASEFVIRRFFQFVVTANGAGVCISFHHIDGVLMVQKQIIISNPILAHTIYSNTR